MNTFEIFFMNSKVLKAEKIISFQWMKQHIILDMKVIHFRNIVHPYKKSSGLLRCICIDLLQCPVNKGFYCDDYLIFLI